MIRKWMISALFLIQSSPVQSQSTIHIFHGIDAPISCVWDVVYNLANWSEWNDVFDIHIDGLPEVGDVIEITASWFLSAPTFTRSRISVVEDTDTLKRICWDLQELGVPNIRGTEALFYIPTPIGLVWKNRCIELTQAQTSNGTIVDNSIGFEGITGGFVSLFYKELIRRGFDNLGDTMDDEVVSTGCDSS